MHQHGTDTETQLRATSPDIRGSTLSVVGHFSLAVGVTHSMGTRRLSAGCKTVVECN